MKKRVALVLGVLLIVGLLFTTCDNGNTPTINLTGSTWSGTASSYSPLVIVFFNDGTFEMTYTNANFEPDEVFGFKGTYTYSGNIFIGVCTSTKAGNSANWVNTDQYNISPFNGTQANNILTLSKDGVPWLNGTVLSKQ
jgi:hypothetical protein